VREGVTNKHAVKGISCVLLDRSIRRRRYVASFSAKPDHGVAGVDSDLLEQHYQNVLIAGAFEKQRETAREIKDAAEESPMKCGAEMDG
jgi:hypothetical protein